MLAGWYGGFVECALGSKEDRVSISSLQDKYNNRCEPGMVPQFQQLLSVCNSLPLHSTVFMVFPSIFFPSLEIVRHYLCLTDENV